jgi:hypothetical protein
MGRRDEFQSFEFSDATQARKRRIPWRWLLLVGLLGAVVAYVWRYQPHRVESALRGTPLEHKIIPSHPRTVYRWRDTDGTVNLSDHPPPPGVRYEEVH